LDTRTLRPAAPLKPLARPQALADQVYNALREQLRNGSIGAGDSLQEVPLATQLGVSRTPVREAMARLASEGLLAADRRSFTVPALTLADVDDIYEVRFLIEPAAIRRVAQITADARKRAPIDAALAAATAAHRNGDSAAFRDANVRYRAAWLALVPNTRLVRIIELYADHMQHIRALTLGRPPVRTIVLRGLRRITAALGDGDADAAAAAVQTHLGNARQAFIEALGLDGAGPAPKAANAAPAAKTAKRST
jgi:DNA-binding GntR family transcriptional regulator